MSHTRWLSCEDVWAYNKEWEHGRGNALQGHNVYLNFEVRCESVNFRHFYTIGATFTPSITALQFPFAATLFGK